MAGAWHERYAWIVFVVIGVVALLIGVSGEDGPTGKGSLVDSMRNADGSDLNNEVFLRGTFALAAGVTTIGLATAGLRRFVPAAWWTLWVWPVFFVLHTLQLGTVVPDAIFAAVTAAALLATARPVLRRVRA